MATDDHGLEVLKKSAEVVDTSATPDPRADQYIKVGGLRSSDPGQPVTPAGKIPPLQTFQEPYGLAVVRGNVTGSGHVAVLGRNDDIDAANEEDITQVGGNYTFLTTASQLTIQSDNANDTLLGSGARTVQIIGLDSSYVLQSETVNMDGTTGVLTTNSYLRARFGNVVTAGVSGVNEGNITMNAGVTPQINIPPEFNRSMLGLFTSADGTEGTINGVNASIIPSENAINIKEGFLTLFLREENGVFRSIWGSGINSRAASPFIPFPYPIVVPPRADVKFRFQPHQNNTKVSVFFDVETRDIS